MFAKRYQRAGRPPKRSLAHLVNPVFCAWARSEGYSLAEVAKLLGVTKERVRQLEARGLRQLRHADPVAVALWKKTIEPGYERDGTEG
jgi:hypothetical protein